MNTELIDLCKLALSTSISVVREHRDDIIHLTHFLPQGYHIRGRVWHIASGMMSPILCGTCGVMCEWTANRPKDKPPMFCSPQCKLKNKTLISRGHQRRKQTCLDRYGVDNPRKSVHVQDGIRQAMMKKYGAENYFSIINSERHPTLRNAPDVYSNISQRHLSEDSIRKIHSSEWLHQAFVIDQLSATEIASVLGYKDTSTVCKHLRAAGIRIPSSRQISSGHRQISEFIKSETGVIPLNNVRFVIQQKGKELDIYLPQLQLAVEYCGLYWHSRYDDRKRHVLKTDACDARGIQLLTIYDDEWIERQEVVKSMLRAKLGCTPSKLHARATTVLQLSTKEKKTFFDDNHIQGDGPSSVSYGLIVDNNIVAAVSFKVHQGADSWELTRFANLLNTSVRGGASKLLSHFIKTHNPTNIVSFADRRWSTGKMYDTLGFKLHSTLPVDYQYVSPTSKVRYHKFGFRHKHLASKLPHYDPQKSEWENCKAAGYNRIWGCGLKRYVWTR